MNHAMPTTAQLRQARNEFKRIEPRDFFYWSVTRLVSSILDSDTGADKIDELVRALMMLLTTWNKNYYRFFERRKGGMTLEEHFEELERTITKHFDRLAAFRKQRLFEVAALPESEISEIFRDFAGALGRVGAAKCLHLLAPGFFPLWDAAILKGYGLERASYRCCDDAARYVAFVKITKAQIANLPNLDSNADNLLKRLDEYNYCTFTKKMMFA
jgi:hypothetical protein